MVDFQVKKLTKRAELEEPDRFSQLPEPILVYILSFLSTEEASRTSVLSRDWRWRWLFVDEFNFNTSRFINTQGLEFTRTSHDVSVVRGLFFEWVNTVLESRRVHVEEASRLNKLRFQFPLELDSWYKMKIDKWLEFAFAKRVQSLELDLFRHSKPSYMSSCGYYLPRRLLTETKTDFSFLKSLSLSGVNVSREDIDSLLLRFHFLEHLKLCRPYLLNSIEIGSSSRALKHLEIIQCSMSSIIVRDTCLVSLAFTWVDSLVLKNNPQLVSVCLSESLNIGLFVNHGAQIQMLSSCLSRLHTLSLDLNYSNDDENLDQVPELLDLKELTLIVDPDLKGTLVRLTTLLSLSPKLEKLVLGFVNMSSARLGRKKASKKGPFPLEHLKAVEVRGYNGKSGAEDKLLKCIFQHIVAPLERIIFVPHFATPDYSSPCNVPKSETSVEKRIELLKGVVEMGAKRFKRAKKRVMSSEVEFIVKN